MRSAAVRKTRTITKHAIATLSRLVTYPAAVALITEAAHCTSPVEKATIVNTSRFGQKRSSGSCALGDSIRSEQGRPAR